MPAGSWTPTNGTRTRILNGTFDFDSDSWKVALLTSTSNIGAGSTTFAGVTGEVANGNGYASGGVSVSINLSGTTTVSAVFATNPTWTANGGSITARYAVLYEVGGDVAFYCLLDNAPANVIATDGNTLTIDSDGTPNPIFTLA